jgi:hypothetical protein
LPHEQHLLVEGLHGDLDAAVVGDGKVEAADVALLSRYLKIIFMRISVFFSLFKVGILSRGSRFLDFKFPTVCN